MAAMMHNLLEHNIWFFCFQCMKEIKPDLEEQMNVFSPILDLLWLK